VFNFNVLTNVAFHLISKNYTYERRLLYMTQMSVGLYRLYFMRYVAEQHYRVIFVEDGNQFYFLFARWQLVPKSTTSLSSYGQTGVKLTSRYNLDL